MCKHKGETGSSADLPRTLRLRESEQREEIDTNISQLAGSSLELFRTKSVNDDDDGADDGELEAREVDVRLTDDRASFEVWPAPFAFPCSDVAAQLA